MSASERRRKKRRPRKQSQSSEPLQPAVDSFRAQHLALEKSQQRSH